MEDKLAYCPQSHEPLFSEYLLYLSLLEMIMMLEHDRKFKEWPLFVQSFTISHVLPKRFSRGWCISNEFKSGGEIEVPAQGLLSMCPRWETTNIKVSLLIELETVSQSGLFSMEGSMGRKDMLLPNQTIISLYYYTCLY